MQNIIAHYKGQSSTGWMRREIDLESIVSTAIATSIHLLVCIYQKIERYEG